MTDNLVENLPKKTPTWAVGISVILVSAATSFVTVYVVAKDEVKDMLSYKANALASHEEADNKRFDDVLASVLGMTRANTEQIVTLSKALSQAREENIVLSARVSALEKSLSLSDSSLSNCLDKLRKNGVK